MKTIPLFLALIGNVAVASSKFDLSASIFEIVHNRQDLRIEKLWIQAACFNQDGTSADLSSCAEIKLDGNSNGGFMEFLAVPQKTDQINTKDISIHYQQKSGKFFCIGMKVLFEGFPNKCDEVLYTQIKDRYSILSFCTIDELPENTSADARFSNRRLATWHDFSLAFAKPIQLELTSSDRPNWCDE